MAQQVSTRRIVFMGTPGFAVESLRALLDAGIAVAAVVTAPDRPAGRGQQLRMSAVKTFALERGLPVLQPEKLRDPAFLDALDALRADLYVVVAFRMLPAVVWQKPPLGTINLHASLLPAYRGAAPINWALINGEHRTGATTFFIREEIDTGDILDRVELPIGPDENAGELHDRLMRAGAELLTRTVRRLLDGDRTSSPQQAADGALPSAPKLTPENCRVRWDLPAQLVHDHIRGLSPQPGAWSVLRRPDGREERFKLLAARPVDGSAAAPGTVHADGSLRVRCADGWIELLELQPEGKRRMAAADYLRGAAGLHGAMFT